MLDVSEIVVAFGDRVVLDHVSLHVDRREVVALQGPSGSGKSTLLRVIAGLLQPQSGSVSLDGRDITTTPVHRRSIGMVFQDNQLFPHRDVAGNVEFGLLMLPDRAPRAQRARRVREVLALVGLSGFESRSVTSLSGGEAKRVALARSLAPSPPVVLLDEPLTGLDDELHERLVVDISALLRSTGTTAILVTHDRAEAEAVADRVVSLESIGRAPRDGSA